MRTSPVTAAAAVVLLALPSCQQPAVYEGNGDPDVTERVAPERPLATEGMGDVMKAKLTHVQALLESIAVGDLPAAAHHADTLTWLSERSDWQVHTSESYTILSDQFRQTTRAIAEHARGNDGDAVAADYVQMTAACLNCHSYLRREGLGREMPGVMSMGE